MANQAAAPSRQWFRSPTIARPSPDPVSVKNSPLPKSPDLTKSIPNSSPKPRVSAPPSPSSLKSEAKIPLQEDQKKVVVVEKWSCSSNKPNAHHQVSEDNGENETKGLINYMKKINPDYEDRITLAGANKGAMMRIVDSPLETERMSMSSKDEEGKIKKKEKRHKARDQRMSAYINSNVQGINNSIVCRSTFTGHDPGAHVSLFTNP